MSSFADRLRIARIVPVIRHADPDIALQGCTLLAEEGIAALEITTTVPGAADLIAALRARYPGICIGAGTVLTAEQADAVLNAGAEFVVSPCWSEEAARRAMIAEKPYLPGAMTPGEVFHHWNQGAAVVKVFPADAVGGPGFLKALSAVFPDVHLMPTGGVSQTTVQSYLDAGALCVGMGGNLLPVEELEAGDVSAARRRVRAVLAPTKLQRQ